jgi:hypothetical protein
MKLDRDVKLLYLNILKNLVINSSYNCSFLASKTIVQRLLIYLRVDADE